MTNRINDPSLAERLTSRLKAKGGNYALSFFGAPDKCDPLNEFAILSAVAVVNGVQCGWSVKTVNVRGETEDERIEKLLADLAAEIDAKPAP